MQTVRRLYLYVMSGITLGVLLVGLNLLLSVVLRELGVGSGSTVILGDSSDSNRQQLSAAAAAIGVGLPVWFIHWLVIERSVDPRRATAEAERGSSVRGLFFSIVLGLLLIFGAGAANGALSRIFIELMESGASVSDLSGSLATFFVTGAAWLYHAAIRRRDMERGPLIGAAAWLPRLYLYGAAGVALVLLLVNLGELARLVVERMTQEPVAPGAGESFAAMRLGTLAAGIVVLGIVWLGHWAFATRLIGDSGWRGESERPARLRLAYFVAIIGASAIAVLAWGVAAGRAVIQRLLDEPGAGGAWSQLIIAGLAVLPWLVAWWLHLAWVRGEARASAEPTRIALVERLERHAAALVGIGFGAVGIGWMIGLLLDAVLGGSRTALDAWRSELANFLPAAILGFALWGWKWAALQARHAADPPGEAASTVRRAFLLVTLAAAVIASLGSLGFVLYRLFGNLLGADLPGNAVSEISTPLGALVVAVAVAAYHGLALRRDMALRAEAPEEDAAPDAGPMTRRLVLSAPPGSDLDEAVAALRSHLPPDHHLDPE
jgi:hypothetical protein